VLQSCLSDHTMKSGPQEDKAVDEVEILAGLEDFGNVSICPGGIIHINLPHCSLKFTPSDFSRFAELIGLARLKTEARQVTTDGKPQLQIVPSKNNKEAPTDQSDNTE
jgi:hypothetical protein